MPAPPSLNVLGVPVQIYLEADTLGGQAVVERFPPEGPSATVQFKCAYNQRYTVVKGLRGGAIASGKTVVYLPPASYPPSTNLKCTSIGEIRGIKPWTDATGWVNYREAVITATFTVPTWDAFGETVTDPSGQPMTTTKFRGSAEVFAPPGGAYFYTSGTSNGKQVVESSVGVVRSRIQISMTRHSLPFPTIDKLMFDVGTVNVSPVKIADRTFPVGCLLFVDFDTEPVADPSTGNRCWDYTFNLVGNYNIEWNEFMDPSGAWVKINTKADGSGDYPFEYEDLSYLFGTVF